MSFVSSAYILFLAAVCLLYFRLPHRWQNRMLLVASYVFYGWWDWRFLGLILFSSLVDYACGLWMAERGEARASRRRWAVTLSVVTNLGLLAAFKYFGFFVASARALLGSFPLPLGLDTLDIILPVGISFYTFQSMSYTIDVYRGDTTPTRKLDDFLLYVSFFPQLVAGPIERSRHLLPQIQSPRLVDGDTIARGAQLALVGFFKKMVVADNLAPYVESVFRATSTADMTPDGFSVVLATWAFAIQIYGDFSGYTDIARGSARMLGFDLGPNFRAPYLATNPSDFWQRWHISLSSWLRDYLYIPLGGNRGGRFKTYRNLTLTMLLGGLWHGAAWNFVVWGAFHGVLLVVFHQLVSRREMRKVTARRRTELVFWLKAAAFFQLTCVGWLLFRVDDLSQAATFATVVFTSFAPAVIPWATIIKVFVLGGALGSPGPGVSLAARGRTLAPAVGPSPGGAAVHSVLRGGALGHAIRHLFHLLPVLMAADDTTRPPLPPTVRAWVYVLFAVAVVEAVVAVAVPDVPPIDYGRRFYLAGREPTFSEAAVHWQVVRARTHARAAEVVIIGDSTALTGLVPQELEKHLGHTVENLATVGPLHIHGHLDVLEEYLRVHPAPALIVYHFGDWSTGSTEEEIERIGMLDGLRGWLGRDERLHTWWPGYRLRTLASRALGADLYMPRTNAANIGGFLYHHHGYLRDPRPTVSWADEEAAPIPIDPYAVDAFARLGEISYAAGAKVAVIHGTMPDIFASADAVAAHQRNEDLLRPLLCANALGPGAGAVSSLRARPFLRRLRAPHPGGSVPAQSGRGRRGGTLADALVFLDGSRPRCHSDPMRQDERRRAARYPTVFPLEVDCGNRTGRVAVSINASTRGILFASRSSFDIGAEVAMRLLLTSDDVRTARGRVVRQDREPGNGVWAHRTAVEFIESLPDLEPLLRSA